MTTISLRGVEFIFVCHTTLSKYQADALRIEFGNVDVVEVIKINQSTKGTIIKVMVPVTHDLLPIIMERTINRINQIVKVR